MIIKTEQRRCKFQEQNMQSYFGNDDHLITHLIGIWAKVKLEVVVIQKVISDLTIKF